MKFSSRKQRNEFIAGVVLILIGMAMRFSTRNHEPGDTVHTVVGYVYFLVGGIGVYLALKNFLWKSD